MRRVHPDKRGVAGFGSCGHQPGTLGRPPQTERQQVWAGTPVDQTAWEGEASTRRQEGAPAPVSFSLRESGSCAASVEATAGPGRPSIWGVHSPHHRCRAAAPRTREQGERWIIAITLWDSLDDAKAGVAAAWEWVDAIMQIVRSFQLRNATGIPTATFGGNP